MYHSSDISFNIKPLNPQAYHLEILFSSPMGPPTAKLITFTKEHQSCGNQTILDIFTKNGLIQDNTALKINKLFDLKKDLPAMQSFSQLDKNIGPVVGVFDYKDKNHGYKHSDNIKHAEATACEFMANQNSYKNARLSQLQQLFHKKIDYFITEGSLKAEIVNSALFSDEEIARFHMKGDGSQKFCQLAEFVMNGLKFGQTAKACGTEFTASKFILPVTPQTEPFTPQKQSLVFYPEEYLTTYAIDSPFAQTLSSVFKVSHQFSQKIDMKAPSNTTTLFIKEKKV